MATQNSVNTSLSGQSGTGAFAGTTSPSFVTPSLGTPSGGTLTNCTGLPVATGLATASPVSSVLVSSAIGTPSWAGAMTNGQIIIGTTSGTPAPSTLTAGTGITITNGAGSVTISASGEGAWVDQTTTTVTMVIDTGYTINAGASLVTLTLPATAAIGDALEINGQSAGGWTIAQNANQLIRIGNVASTTGVGGSVSSTDRYDCVRLRCIVGGASTAWTVVSMQSSGLTYV